MLIDARTIERGATLDADLAIVGGGPAGIALGLRLARAGLEVVLLEAGGQALEPEAQDPCAGAARGSLLPEGSPYLGQSRPRLLGGATSHWGGWCRPLGALDLAPRPWVPGSGWPFPPSELERPYGEACRLLEIAPFDYDGARRAQMARRPLSLPPELGVETELFHQSQSGNFGRRYLAELESTPGLKVLLHAPVCRVCLDANGAAVRELAVGTPAAPELRLRARRYVLAAGGLENARLLLLSDDVQRGGVGNDRGLVGRYFMDHPHVPLGRVALWGRRGELALYTGFGVDEGLRRRTLGVLRLADREQRRLGLLNAAFSLVIVPDALGATRQAHEGFFLSYAGHSFPRQELPPAGSADYEALYQRHLSEAALFRSAAQLGRDVATELGEAPAGGAFHGVLFARAEQAPSPESRVWLDDALDGRGQRRLRLDWRLGELDRQSLLRSARHLGRAFGAAGMGRLQILEPEGEGWPHGGGGCHHMGTTRMSADPARGVVDGQLRVHGVANLYVAGSSVFPTSGYANPTLTILALVVRLGEHLLRELKR